MWGPPLRAFLPPSLSSLPGSQEAGPWYKKGQVVAGGDGNSSGGCRWGFSGEQSRGSVALGLSEEEGEGAAPAGTWTHRRGEVKASIRIQPSRRDRQRSGKKLETAERRPDAPRDKESTVALTPDSGIAWELRAVKTCSSHIGGARSRPVAGDTGWRGPPRWRAGGEAAPRGQEGGGGAAANMPQGHPKERGSGVRPRLPCARRPPAGRGGLCGGAPRRMLSTSRFWKSLPGPRVCLPPPPALPRPPRGQHVSAGLPAPSCAPAAPAPSGA